MLARILILLVFSWLSFSPLCHGQQPYNVIYHTHFIPSMGFYEFHSINRINDKYYVLGMHRWFTRSKIRLGKFSLDGDSVNSTYLPFVNNDLIPWSESKVVAADELVSLIGLHRFPLDSMIIGQRIIRYDTSGTVLWDTTLMPPTINFELYDFQPTADGGVIFTGKLKQNDDADAFWIKWDSTGNEVWRRTLSNTNNYASGLTVIKKSANTFWIPTFRMQDSLYYLDLTTINHDGHVIRTKRHSIEKLHSWQTVATKDGGLLVYGTKPDQVFPWKHHLTVHKFGYNGAFQFNRTHRLPWNYYSLKAISTADSGFVFVGKGEETKSTNQSSSVWLKLDKEGHLIWHRDYKDQPGSNLCKDALENPNGTLTGVGERFPAGHIIYLDSIGCFPGPCDTCSTLPKVTGITLGKVRQYPSYIRIEINYDSIPDNILKIWAVQDSPYKSYISTNPTQLHLRVDSMGAYQVCLGLLNECGDYRDTCFMINVFPLAVEEKEPLKVKLFPNPATEVVQLQLQQSMPGAQLELITVDGRILGNYDINGTHQEIATDSLTSGFYIAVIRDAHGVIVWRTKFIVQ